jgi:hypothetical protein
LRWQELPRSSKTMAAALATKLRLLPLPRATVAEMHPDWLNSAVMPLLEFYVVEVALAQRRGVELRDVPVEDM